MNIGIDIVENKRIASKSKNPKFLKRVLGETELIKYNSLNKKKQKVNFLAGRFSAKEAVIKATNKQYLFSRIEIINSPTGKPEVFYEGFKKNHISISISHENKFSVSVAIIDNK